ncbi:MAG TPA: hypothetical protein VGI29_08970, partial [Candidatus Binataceae bacterium]
AASGAVEGIGARMQKVSALLRSPAVHFVLVTTAESNRLQQAERLIERTEADGLHLDAVVINRFLDESIFAGFDRTLDEIPALADALRPEGAGDSGIAAALEYLESYGARAEHNLRRVRRFVHGLPQRMSVAFAPELRSSAPGLAALGRLADFLVTPQTAVGRPERRTNAPRGGADARRWAAAAAPWRSQSRETRRMPE